MDLDLLQVSATASAFSLPLSSASSSARPETEPREEGGVGPSGRDEQEVPGPARVEALRRTAAAVRFQFIEPLLGGLPALDQYHLNGRGEDTN